MYQVRRFGLILAILVIGLIMGKYGSLIFNLSIIAPILIIWFIKFDEASYMKIQKKHR